MNGLIETCRYTVARPGVCCVCEQPARYAVLLRHALRAGDLLMEHLRCVDCAAKDRADPVPCVEAIKDYHPRTTQTPASSAVTTPDRKGSSRADGGGS